jgi:ABC-type branched-subunit amino acid transport system substrate-binding protein
LPAPAPPPPKPYATAALLLPLTGQAALTGAALFNAAQLALFEVADTKFTLLPFDTKGTAEGTEAAMRLALANPPDIVIGPLFAPEVRAAAPLARQAHIPMIALSSDATVAGDGIYTLGFLPGPQALRVLSFAGRRGRHRIAVLAPDDEYGKRVGEQVTINADKLGVAVVSTQYYDAGATDLAGPIKRMVKVDPANPGDPGFDALMLPDTGARLRQVAAQLPVLGVDATKVKLLGTMLWDDANPGSEPTLNGGWYPAPPSANHLAFLDRYAKTFGSKPVGIASLAYDATALAAVLAKASPRDFGATALTNPAGFAGVDGLFRLLADGTAERGYAIDEVIPGAAASEIDPAPTSFPAPGS